MHLNGITVPFRLTQNMVDGLGPTGVEGAFTKVAETTMVLLRHNASALLTILSAIATDPLYMWTLSPVKARARQLAVMNIEEEDHENIDHMSQYEEDPAIDVLRDKHDKEKREAAMNVTKRNDQATHVIAKVQQKLQGYEEDIAVEQQGVEGQIQLLFNQARDVENLAVMYPGWAPWL